MLKMFDRSILYKKAKIINLEFKYWLFIDNDFDIKLKISVVDKDNNNALIKTFPDYTIYKTTTDIKKFLLKNNIIGFKLISCNTKLDYIYSNNNDPHNNEDRHCILIRDIIMDKIISFVNEFKFKYSYTLSDNKLIKELDIDRYYEYINIKSENREFLSSIHQSQIVNFNTRFKLMAQKYLPFKSSITVYPEYENDTIYSKTLDKKSVIINGKKFIVSLEYELYISNINNEYNIIIQPIIEFTDDANSDNVLTYIQDVNDNNSNMIKLPKEIYELFNLIKIDVNSDNLRIKLTLDCVYYPYYDSNDTYYSVNAGHTYNKKSKLNNIGICRIVNNEKVYHTLDDITSTLTDYKDNNQFYGEDKDIDIFLRNAKYLETRNINAIAQDLSNILNDSISKRESELLYYFDLFISTKAEEIDLSELFKEDTK